MASAYLQRSADLSPAAVRRRSFSIALAVAVNLLLLWLLLRVGPSLTEPPRAREQTSFQLLPDRAEAPEPVRQPAAKPQHRAARAGAAAPAAPAPRPTSPVPVPTPAAPSVPWTYMREDFDLAKVPHRSREPGDTGENAPGKEGDPGDAVAAYGPGEGPGGQRLYDADWFREPTDAELSFYLKRGAPAGAWATIACRTAERYHVENCRMVDESPAGSGLANAVRQAAWQFLVIPPRIGGRQLVGSWVRIRIDFTDRGAQVRR